MDENEDKEWWRPKSSHAYSHLQPACQSQWYLCAALCVTLTLSLSVIILMPSHFGSVDRKLSDLERSVSNLTESVSFHLSKLHEKVGSLEMKLSDLKRSVSNRIESVSFHSAKLPNKGVVGCTDGWSLQNSSCYFFSAFTASWYTARDFCRSMDATLLILTDEEEWGFVNRMRAGGAFWLGLSDERTGEWEWVNGSPYIMDQSKWRPGQPDNWTGHSVGGTEDCAHFTTDGKLNDNHCTVTYKFICKATLAPN